jgi:hypothetical protein
MAAEYLAHASAILVYLGDSAAKPADYGSLDLLSHKQEMVSQWTGQWYARSAA